MLRPSYNPEEALANRIIEVTAEDYMEALRNESESDKIMKQKPFNPKTYYPAEDIHWNAVGMIKECELFFNSRLFRCLTSVNGPWLMEQLRVKAFDRKEASA